MLTKEWKLEDALAVRFEEGREERDREVLDLIAKGYILEDIQRELTPTAQSCE